MRSDPRVQAIRSHPKLGEGSCSAVDECMTDEEIIQELDALRVGEPEQAVTHYLWAEGLQNEIEDDVRGAGNVSPLHSPREPGRQYDDDPPMLKLTGNMTVIPLDADGQAIYDGSPESEYNLMDEEERYFRYGRSGG